MIRYSRDNISTIQTPNYEIIKDYMFYPCNSYRITGLLPASKRSPTIRAPPHTHTPRGAPQCVRTGEGGVEGKREEGSQN